MGNTLARDGKGHGTAISGQPIPNHRGPSNISVAMENSPPESPSSAARSPLMFTPQVPMVPIPKSDEFLLHPYPGGGGAYGDADQFGGDDEQLVPTMIAWTHNGNSVSVEGSWDNWTTRTQLQRSGKDSTIVKMLPPGIYQYKFIVDGDWRYAPDLPAVYDEMHNVNNVLEVQEYIPENPDNIASFDPPLSPPSSYNSPFPAPEDFAKEPPPVPPHLHLTLLNVPPAAGPAATLPRPQHVILNHLYVEKGKAARSVLAQGMTHRFRSKYVTVVLYKPVQR